MQIWRLVLSENNITLTELETTWNIDDVERALAVMDMQQEYQEAKMPKPGKSK